MGKKVIKFNERFIKDYNEKSDKGYSFEVDVKYLKKLFNLHKDLPFLPERKKIEKVKKLLCDIKDKENYVVHIRALKQALSQGLKLKKSTQSNSIQSKSLIETIHLHEY